MSSESSLLSEIKVRSEGGDLVGGRRVKSLKIIVLGIIASEQPSALNAETRYGRFHNFAQKITLVCHRLGEQLARGLLKILGDDGTSAYGHSLQLAAVELLGKSFSVWSSSEFVCCPNLLS